MDEAHKQKMAEGRKRKGSKRKCRIDVFDLKQENALRDIARDASSCLGIFKRAFEGKSKKASINAMCLQCTNYDRDYVKHCTSTSCALWAVRPYQKPSGSLG